MTPKDRRYSKAHQWVKIEDELAIVGITDHAQRELGEITFVELPEGVRPVDKDEAVGVVESAKAASEIFSPISGEIAEINRELEESPELINDSPCDEGWIVKLADFSEEDYDALMDSTEYQALIHEEGE